MVGREIQPQVLVQPPTEAELAATQDRLRASNVWFPGDELNDPLSSPSTAAFSATFEATVQPGKEVVQLDGLLSALSVPQQLPKGYLLLDLHDTVADLGGSLQLLQHAQALPVRQRENAHDYGQSHPDRKMFFTDDQRALKAQLYAHIHASEFGLQPVEGFAEITNIVTQLRSKGVYTGFITSVTKGSELSVVSNFIGRYFAGNCDFVTIPVTPEGKDYKSVDKGLAAVSIIKRFGYKLGMPVVAIDDLPGNTRKFREALTSLEPGLRVQTIQPLIPSDRDPDTGSHLAQGSLAAFQQASKFLLDTLGVNGQQLA